MEVLEWTGKRSRGSCDAPSFRSHSQVLDIDRVVPLNEANVDEYLLHRTQFVNQGRECDEMLD